ncbi:hypothetical protein HDF08_003969 [Edaphobacter lichenicola]|uniref:Uncharacterized protein n=1 Tax=Tunturiibacter lichenicola TaxID=2051959 RepID=A0A852VJP2_9BACT|nr:hypothetical protein [Edaphobacter lichenicola]
MVEVLADFGIAHNYLGFHKEICRFGDGFTPRIKQTLDGRDASWVQFGVQFGQQPLTQTERQQ